MGVEVFHNLALWGGGDFLNFRGLKALEGGCFVRGVIVSSPPGGLMIFKMPIPGGILKPQNTGGRQTGRGVVLYWEGGYGVGLGNFGIVGGS